MPDDPYVAALTLLARRELSEAQLRERLIRRGHARDAIDAAIARLTADGRIDDERAARMIARSEVEVRKRGKLRVKRRIEAAGIAPAIAQRVVEETFAEFDADVLLADALARRLRGRSAIADDREFRRLYRYLVAQGFDPDRVFALLRSRRTDPT